MNIDKVLLMDMKKLNNYILEECSRKEKIRLLKDKNIRKKYLSIDSYNYVFLAFFLIGLKADVKYFIDEDFIDLIFDDESFVEDRLRSIMVCSPEMINKFSNDIRIIKTIVNSEQLIRHVNKFDDRFGKCFFEYIIDCNKTNDFLLLSETVQIELLKDNNNLELLKRNNVSDLFISMFSGSLIDIIIKDDYFRNRIVNMNIDIFDSIVSNGAAIPFDNIVIDKYVNVNNIDQYRAYIENLNKRNSNLVDIIEKKRQQKYDLIFDAVSSDGLLDEYKKLYNSVINGEEIDVKYKDLVIGFYGDFENIFNFLYEESSDRLQEILIDRYFEDIPSNFLMNLDMVLNFILSVDKELISVENLKLYNKIHNFKELSVSDKIKLYKSMNNGKNYKNIFYDDYRKCRDYAYSLYNEQVIKIDNMNKSLLSSKYGVDVYELDGEDFTAYIHQTKYDRDSHNLEGIWEEHNNINDAVALSLSMIDQNHIDTIYGMDLFVCFGFSNLDIDRIIHVYHTDSYTKNFKSDRVNEILTVDNLMNRTEDYNEIFYLENNLAMKYGNKKHERLIPSYILSYDNITDFEIDVAKHFNIPIVLLHSNKYSKRGYVGRVQDKIYKTGYEKKGIKR